MIAVYVWSAVALLGWLGIACVVFAVLGAAAGRWSR